MGGAELRRLVGFPEETTSFVGRRHELAEAKRALTAARLVTLTGPGGVGKTRLAMRLARQVARSFDDGVWLVPLAALQDGALVPHAVADALGVRDEATRQPLDTLVEHLRGRRLLLVLDNCEHVSGACAAFVGAVLAAAEGVRVLATSRHMLGLTEEHAFAVRPLRTPDAEITLNRRAVDEFPALRLFAERAAAVVSGFAITEKNQAAVARLCNRLDGLPLAIELAAVRMRVLGVEQVEERMGRRYQLLTSGSPAAPPRHQTLRSTVDWSYDLCSPQEQLVWARLGVFTGSFDLNAAEAVCSGEDLDEVDVLDAVDGLMEKSILTREDVGGRARYRLLALLREYGLERLEALGEVVRTRRRHRDHFLRVAQEFEKKWFGPDQHSIMTRLRSDHDNLRQALEFCLASAEEAGQGLRLLGTVWFYWATRGAWPEARYWWMHLLERQGGKPTGALVRAMWVGGVMHVVHTRTTPVFLVGPPQRPTLGPHRVPGIKPLADVLPAELATAEGQLSFQVLNRVEIACALICRGRPEHAIPLCVEVLAVCEAHGEQWARSYVLQTLALARWVLGDNDRAVDSARQCLRLEYVVREPKAVGRTLEMLAVIAASQGDAERTAVLQGAAHRIWNGIGHDPLSGQQLMGWTRTSERQAREALGNRGYERANRRGHELTPEEALAYALGDRPGLPAGSASDRAGESGTASGPKLTRRELEVAGLIAQGLTNRQIAETLVVARRTAEGHVERILAKLGFTTRTQVALWVSQRRQDGRSE